MEINKAARCVLMCVERLSYNRYNNDHHCQAPLSKDIGRTATRGLRNTISLPSTARRRRRCGLCRRGLWNKLSNQIRFSNTSSDQRGEKKDKILHRSRIESTYSNCSQMHSNVQRRAPNEPQVRERLERKGLQQQRQQHAGPRGLSHR